MTTLRRSITGIALVGTLALLAPACGEAGDGRADPTSSIATEVPTTAGPPSTVTPPTAAPTSAPAPTTATTTSGPPTTVGATMPDVVGLGLQEAQNRIQATGVFYSRSFDCTGAGRQQVLDRNWVVVTQAPDPGTPIDEGDARLGVVKLDEARTCV